MADHEEGVPAPNLLQAKPQPNYYHLDKLKYYSTNKPALLYVTWGLIWDTQCSSLGSFIFAYLGGIEGIMSLTDTIITLCYYYTILPLQYHKQPQPQPQDQ